MFEQQGSVGCQYTCGIYVASIHWTSKIEWNALRTQSGHVHLDLLLHETSSKYNFVLTFDPSCLHSITFHYYWYCV